MSQLEFYVGQSKRHSEKRATLSIDEHELVAGLADNLCHTILKDGGHQILERTTQSPFVLESIERACEHSAIEAFLPQHSGLDTGV